MNGFIKILFFNSDTGFESPLTTFLLLIISNFLIKFLQTAGFFFLYFKFNYKKNLQKKKVFGDIPYRIENLLKRQSYLKKSTIEVFKKSTDK